MQSLLSVFYSAVFKKYNLTTFLVKIRIPYDNYSCQQKFFHSLKLFNGVQCLKNRTKHKGGDLKVFFREKKEEKKEKIIEKIICDKYNSYYRMAYSHVQNALDAEDIVQNVQRKRTLITNKINVLI